MESETFEQRRAQAEALLAGGDAAGAHDAFAALVLEQPEDGSALAGLAAAS